MKNRMRTRITAAAAVISIAIPTAFGQVKISSVVTTFYFGVETPLPNPDHPDTVDIFHTDLNLPYSGCQWNLAVSHDDLPPTPENPDGDRLIDPEDALIYVNPNARFNLPSIPAGFEFIGATPGEDFWILPQSQNPNVLWIGTQSEDSMTPADLAALAPWNPGDPRAGADVTSKWFRLQLVDVRGPADGHFSWWQTDFSGTPVVYMSTFDGGVTEEDVYHEFAGGHQHMNLGFTKPGLYEVDFQVSTYLVGQLNEPRFDEDGDGDVDQTDFAAFQRCISGEGKAYVCGCEWADGDVDGDVDPDDYTRFQTCTSGPTISADPGCDDD